MVAIQLLRDSLCDGLLLWKYDSAYFANAAVQAAIAQLFDSLSAPITTFPLLPPLRPTVTAINQHLQYFNATKQLPLTEHRLPFRSAYTLPSFEHPTLLSLLPLPSCAFRRNNSIP